MSPLQGADTSGQWGIGLRGGAYKLVLTDRSDIWTTGWLAGVDVKYGIIPKLSVGVEGSWMQLYLADLTKGSKAQDGAGLFNADNVNGGARQRDFTAGLFAQYQFLADRFWSPYVCAGTGIYFWKWVDRDWKTLSSDIASQTVDPRVPPHDKAGNVYDMKDQQLYLMGGLGLEFFPCEVLSFELGAKFRYLTELFSSFKDDKDIVGTGPDQLDLPKGVAEAFIGLTFHFGGKVYPPVQSTATVSPAFGPVPLTVQLTGSGSGGHPDYTYAWNFGDGSSSTEQNPSHTYQAAGDYGASLTVTDSKGMMSQCTVPLRAICPTLICGASGNPASGTVPLSVQFNGSATGGCPPVLYSWDFGDGSTSVDQNPSHVFAKAGDYTASLTVTDAKGTVCQKSISVKGTEAFIPTPEKPLVLEGVNFASGKAVLLEGSKNILDNVAASLIAHPEVKVEVAGHTDAIGSDASNLKLSQARANTVLDYLISKGVPAAQLTAKGYGESKPIADNATPEGRAKNRRVELKRM
jgi:outer membrane protein OmpA-like peptidoglycan-associated protein